MKSSIKAITLAIGLAGSAIVGAPAFAAADDSVFPPPGFSERPLPPTKSTYQEEHADSVGAPIGDVFPPPGFSERPLPLTKSTYQEEHADSVGAPMGDVFPPPGFAERPLPLTKSTYEAEEAATQNAQARGSSNPN